MKYFTYLYLCCNFVYAFAVTKSDVVSSNPTRQLVAESTLSKATAKESSSYNRVNNSVILDRIVAFVNKGVITSNQVDKQLLQALSNLKQRGITNFNINDVRARVIDQMIMQKIELDLASRLGIKTSDIEVNDAISTIIKSQNTTIDGLKSKLYAQGTSYDEFYKQLQTQLILDKLKQREVDGRVVVNDDEVNLVLDSEAYKNRVDYHLAMVSIATPEQVTSQAIKQQQNLANQAYAELKSGVPFEQVALKYSNAQNALNGGDLGWKSSATLPPLIASSLKDLRPGEYTEVIKLPVGFFIFKVIEIRKHGMMQIVRQYHVRHILIKVNETVGDDEAHQKIIDIRAKLDQDKHNAVLLDKDFIKYAKQYSDDTSSISGGDLGWVSIGDTVPVFEKAILQSKIGVISDPIRTVFGWHLLEVLAVRDSNLSNDREKANIRQELHDNKAAIMYAQWIRDIKEMAYVKMNDE